MIIVFTFLLLVLVNSLIFTDTFAESPSFARQIEYDKIEFKYSEVEQIAYVSHPSYESNVYASIVLISDREEDQFKELVNQEYLDAYITNVQEYTLCTETVQDYCYDDFNIIKSKYTNYDDYTKYDLHYEYVSRELEYSTYNVEIVTIFANENELLELYMDDYAENKEDLALEEFKNLAESFKYYKVNELSSLESQTTLNGYSNYSNDFFYIEYPEDWYMGDLFVPEDQYPPDIKAVSYLSDGKILNGTIWFEYPVDLNFNYIDFYITIDSDNDFGSGSYGADYLYFYSFDEKSCRTSIEETVSTWIVRELDSSNNTDSCIKQITSHFPFSIDLGIMGYPEQYRFTIETYDQATNFWDELKWVEVPSPKIDFSGTPNPIKIEKGKDGTVTMYWKSESVLPGVVEFSPSPLSNVQKIVPECEYFSDCQEQFELSNKTRSTDGIERTFPIPESEINHDGTGKSTLIIHVLENATKGNYEIPIYSIMKIFNETKSSEDSSWKPIFAREKSATTFLSIEIIDKLAWDQSILNLLGKWDGLLTLITTLLGTGIGAGVTAVVFSYFKRKKTKMNATTN